jgi:hypothetical protein
MAGRTPNVLIRVVFWFADGRGIHAMKPHPIGTASASLELIWSDRAEVSSERLFPLLIPAHQERAFVLAIQMIDPVAVQAAHDCHLSVSEVSLVEAADAPAWIKTEVFSFVKQLDSSGTLARAVQRMVLDGNQDAHEILVGARADC